MTQLVLHIDSERGYQEHVALAFITRIKEIDWKTRYYTHGINEVEEEILKAGIAAVKEHARLMFFLSCPKTGATWARALDETCVENPTQLELFIRQAMIDFERFRAGLTLL